MLIHPIFLTFTAHGQVELTELMDKVKTLTGNKLI